MREYIPVPPQQGRLMKRFISQYGLRPIMAIFLFMAFIMEVNSACPSYSSSEHESKTQQESGNDKSRVSGDSARIEELMLEIQQMKMKELMLNDRIAETENKSRKSDSIRRAAQIHMVDSLRRVTKGVDVIVDSDTLFTLYASLGGRSARDRAERIVEAIERVGKRPLLNRDSVRMLQTDTYIDIMHGDKVLMSVTDMDAIWASRKLDDLASEYLSILEVEIDKLHNEYGLMQNIKRAGLFVFALLVIWLIFRMVNHLFSRLRRRIIKISHKKVKGLIIRHYDILNARRTSQVLIFLSNVLRYLILFLVLVFTIPILFSIFPQTEGLAEEIFDYVWNPIKMVIREVVYYIPNLFIIIVICVATRYLIKGFHYLALEIEHEKLRISGFYPEWARPTFNILRFLLYAFMIAMIYPYLPGAHSGVFQGISVFVGLIVSLGSSGVISNFISGFVITYMRPFKEGDFIKVKDTTGNVIEKTPFVTRLRTIKNEVVTIPNSFIMSSDTVNYSASARKYGLIIHTVMTMCYDVPWRKVHQLLIDAALATPGVVDHPHPFVLETEMNDNYMSYQINAYIKDADRMPDILSDMLQNIQDYFIAAGIDLVATHFYDSRMATRNANKNPELEG